MSYHRKPLVLAVIVLAIAMDGDRALSATVAAARALPIGTSVTIDDLVLTVLYDQTNSTANKRIFGQDATGGIDIFDLNGPIDSLLAGQDTISGTDDDLQPGSRINLTGKTDSFGGLFAIGAPLSWTHNGTVPAPAPIPMHLSQWYDGPIASAEAREGMLVRLQNVMFESPGGTFVGLTNYNIFDGVQSGHARVSNANNPPPIVGTTIPTGRFDIIGILSQFDTSPLANRGYEILINEPGDLIPVPEPTSLFLLALAAALTIPVRHSTKHQRSDVRLRRRLRIEPLEDRRLLSITVNTLVDEADGSIVDGDISLRDAIAKAPDGATIDFAASLTSGGPATINLTRGQLRINKNLTITGPGANLLTIDASASDPTPTVNNGDGTRVFFLENGDVYTVITATISGLTLTGGDVGGNGGAILSGENLHVAGCVFTGNFAKGAGSIGGGGAIGHFGLVENSLTVADSTIRDNVTNYDGGGVFISGGTATITNSTITGNTSGGRGGGVYCRQNNQYVTDSTISNNTSGGNGGGIYCKDEGKFVVTDALPKS